MAGGDLHRDLPLRIFQPEPGHLDHDRETLARFARGEIGIVHSVGDGIKALNGVDAADDIRVCILTHEKTSSVLI